MLRTPSGHRSKGVKDLHVTARRITIAQGAWRHAAMREASHLRHYPARHHAPCSRFRGVSLDEAHGDAACPFKFLPIPDYSSCIQGIPTNDWTHEIRRLPQEPAH